MINPLEISADNKKSAIDTPSNVEVYVATALLGQNITNEVKQQLKAPLLHVNITMNEWLVLKHIFLKRADIPSDIAKSMNVDAASISRSCDGLQARGLVEREHQVNDRRVVRLYLTKKGQEKAEYIYTCYAEIFNNFESRLSQADLALWKIIEQCIATHLNNN